MASLVTEYLRASHPEWQTNSSLPLPSSCGHGDTRGTNRRSTPSPVGSRSQHFAQVNFLKWKLGGRFVAVAEGDMELERLGLKNQAVGGPGSLMNFLHLFGDVLDSQFLQSRGLG